MQLWFLGRADSIPSVSASAIPITPAPGQEAKIPRALEKSELPGIVDMYKQAAINAIEAGCDGVEIHGANGYFLDQFLHTNSNHRNDEYGGCAENRSRLVLEVLEAVSGAIGQERTSIRFSPYSDFQDMKDANPLETWSTVTQAIQDRFPNLAYLHFVEGRVSGASDKADTSDNDSLEPFHKLWKGVFLRAGGFSMESAVAAADQHDKDVIVFGRDFISNPDLPLRLKNGWDLNKYNRATFYENGSPNGYIDYPFYEASKI
jgi:2,4-dienoyl-CoA reductase-like NADH-dependent reductase (Old Yellow Enzyme family)